MPAFRTGTVRLRGGTVLPYAESGDRSGVPVVLVHGYAETWRYFEPLLRHLPKALNGLAYTQQTYGGPAEVAGEIVGFLDAVGLTRAVLVGASSGGVACQLVAGAWPDRVSALVLITSPATLADKPGAAVLRDEVAALDDPIDPAWVAGFVRATSPAGLPDDLAELLVGESLQVPAAGWRASLAGLLDAGLPVELRRIAAPTLLLAGAEDVFVAGDQEVLRDGIRNARLTVYPGAGHGLHLTMPERVAADLAAFVDAVLPG